MAESRLTVCETEHLCAEVGRIFAEPLPQAPGGETPGVLDGAAMRRAAEILSGGGTVAFPTETVYGLGANALDPAAVEKIFAAKQRPHWDPLIVHVADRAMLAIVTEIVPEMLPQVEALMAAFWPGPLTLLLPRSAKVPNTVTAGRALVGVRMPAHPVALELIRLAGVPVAAPSANRFGYTSPTSALHVMTDLDGRIDAILDGGSTRVGVESTVLDLSQSPPVVYRPGAVTLAAIEAVLGTLPVLHVASEELTAAPDSLPSPGVGIRHYAPRARVVLVGGSGSVAERCVLVGEAVRELMAAQETVGVMLPDEWQLEGAARVRVFGWGGWAEHDELARRLFEGLRELDGERVSAIVCPIPEGGGVAAAIRDRLEKAARVR